MRRVMISVIAVMMCACCGFGQSSGLPQWKVVKEFHVIGSASPINSTVLFTPAKDDLYRLTALMSASSQ